MTIFHNSYLVYFFSVPKDEQLHLDQSFEILHLFLPIGYSDYDRVSEFRVIGGPKLDVLFRVVQIQAILKNECRKESDSTKNDSEFK